MWNPVSSTANAVRELFDNPLAGGDSWIEQHALLGAIVWPVLITAVFLPRAVRRYQGLGRRPRALISGASGFVEAHDPGPAQVNEAVRRRRHRARSDSPPAHRISRRARRGAGAVRGGLGAGGESIIEISEEPHSDAAPIR